MNTVQTTMTTTALFSDDKAKRYLLHKVWDEKKPALAILMLAPSEAAGIELDSTTLLVLNNASRLGFGSVRILNLFATLNDSSMKKAEDEDPDNMKAIIAAAKEADTIVYAPGVGKMANKAFQQRQKQVLEALAPYEKKLHCLCDANKSSRFQHPLSPAVRTWHLSPMKIRELINPAKKEKGAEKNGK